MDIAIYVAIAENGVIGRDGGLPWRLSTDCGASRRTRWASPSSWAARPGRVFPTSRCRGVRTSSSPATKSYAAEGADVVHSLEEALTLAKRREGEMANADEICVIGGGEIFAQALPLADRLHVTHVLASIEGDAHFPPIDPANGGSFASRISRPAKKTALPPAMPFTSAGA